MAVKGELPLTAQAKRLRVLQSGEFERVGGGPLHFFDAHTTSPAALPDHPLFQDRVATLDEVTEAHIRATLEKNHGSIGGKSGAAERLGINPSTLHSRLKKTGYPLRGNEQRRELSLRGFIRSHMMG